MVPAMPVVVPVFQQQWPPLQTQQTQQIPQQDMPTESGAAKTIADQTMADAQIGSSGSSDHRTLPTAAAAPDINMDAGTQRFNSLREKLKNRSLAVDSIMADVDPGNVSRKFQ